MLTQPSPTRIAFIKRGLFSHSNLRTLEQLRKQFPECEVDVIDVFDDLLRPHLWLRVIALVQTWLVYWRQLLRRQLPWRQCFYRTPWIFRQFQRLIRQRLAPRRKEYVFSLQTQSLFDASIPGLPHFVYTDHTHLANLQYPAFRRDALFATAWIDHEREIYQHAAQVFVMGGHVRRSLLEQYGCAPERISCILAGSNVDTAPLPLENDGYRNFTIIFVGVDWERKGGPTLLQAFQIVLRTLPEARLLILGCQPEVQHPRVQVIGRVPADDVRRWLVKASVFCLPTRLEPFGIAPIEAFVHHLPVVTTSIGSMPDLVAHGESGLLLTPDDPVALAAALLELLQDPERCRRMAEAGHRTVIEKYTWAATGQRLRDGITERLEQG